ncbi:MAG: 3-isopropylmalate dehydrogenase [Bacteroidales bacterium]|jgi:3-isopropylmalate dehydrogenase|nr:3-isopropylmalate dehydrogenase [Bacteroidales bacterium]
MNYKIAVLPGDGIGPEIIDQAIKALNAVAGKFNHSFIYEYALVGAVAIDKTGSPLPEETLLKCKASDAVLFGAIGDPKYDADPKATVRPEQGLLAMRKELGLYANVRPVTTFPSLLDKSPLRKEIVSGVDILMVRELTGGIYFGKPQGRSEDGKTAYDSCVYSRFEIERVVRLACEYALKRKGKVTVVDKANVLATSRLWRETSKEIASEYPGIEMDFMFVDNAAMQLIQNPLRFDVIVTENMFGDILSDEASVITGSLGLLPSASIGLSTSVFEPIHGSYPQAAGKNIANPLGTILSAAMLLETGLNLTRESHAVTKAAIKSLEAGIVTEDIDRSNPCSTSMVGDRIAEYILST